MRRLISCIVLAACGSTSKPPAEFPPLPGDPPRAAAGGTAGGPGAGASCMPAGMYRVTVDLSSAKISQVNTGMDGPEWCKSMLEAVPATTMRTMRISREAGRLIIEWPPTRPAILESFTDCGFEIPGAPIPAKFTFVDGHGSATTDYSIGTKNHPDERCTAQGAQIRVEPLAAGE